jgi:hypothetical protein
MSAPVPQTVAQRLDVELGDARLTPGQVAYRRLSRGYWQAAPTEAPAGGRAALITLSFGPAPPPSGLAWGLDLADQAPAGSPRWCGRTDRRGQFRARGLPDRECYVRYVPCVRAEIDILILEAVGDEPARQTLLAADGELCDRARQAAERLEARELSADLGGQEGLKFACQDQLVTLRREGDRAVLSVELTGPSASAPLARVRVLDESGDVLAEGFVGLAAHGKGEGDFDALVAGWHDYPGPLRLWVNRQAEESLDWRDYAALDQSRAAARYSSRLALERALRRLRATCGDVLPASAFGVPAAGLVVAVLPADDAALEQALEKELRDGLEKLGREASDGGLVQRAQEKLVGGAYLSPPDQLHISVTAARLLERIRVGLSSGGTTVVSGGTSDTALSTAARMRGAAPPPAVTSQAASARKAEDPPGARLEAVEPFQARVYWLVKYAGCPIEKAAGMLDVSPQIAAEEFGYAVNTIQEWQRGPSQEQSLSSPS